MGNTEYNFKNWTGTNGNGSFTNPNAQATNYYLKNVFAVTDTIRVQANFTKVINKNALRVAINKTNELDENSYTPKSWQEFQNIVSEARTILNDENARQSTVDQMVTDLNEAIDHLILKADKTKLQDLVTSTDKLDVNSYTSESWEAL